MTDSFSHRAFTAAMAEPSLTSRVELVVGLGSMLRDWRTGPVGVDAIKHVRNQPGSGDT